MTSTPTRRTVAKGVAWSAPVVLAASVAPAYAISPLCPLTDAQLNAGFCGPQVGQSWQIVGARTFGNQFGGVENAQTSNNIGFKSACNYKGSVTFKIRNFSGETSLPAPTLRLKDGKTYTGGATLGNVGSGGAKVGFDMGFTIQWENSKHTTDTANRGLWDGAVVTVPMEFSYTAPDSSLHKCMLTLSYSMAGSWNASGAQTMVDPHWTSVTAA